MPKVSGETADEVTKTKTSDAKSNELGAKFQRPRQGQPFVFSFACRRSPSITSMNLLATIVHGPIS
jgi:hypothetical protein